MVVAENYFVEEPQALLLRNKNFAYELRMCISAHYHRQEDRHHHQHITHITNNCCCSSSYLHSLFFGRVCFLI